MAKKISYNRIKAVLAEQGKSSKELAEMLSVSEQTVSRWCTNTRQPSLEAIFEIGVALKVDPRTLLAVS